MTQSKNTDTNYHGFTLLKTEKLVLSYLLKKELKKVEKEDYIFSAEGQGDLPLSNTERLMIKESLETLRDKLLR